MRKTLVAALISAVALAACGQGGGETPTQAADAGGGFPTLNGVGYRAEGVIQHDGRSVPVVMMRDGAKMRIEINAAEGSSVMISNAETGESLMIASAAGRTMALRINSSDFPDPGESWSGEAAVSATRTGDCQVAGETGSEWTSTYEGTASSACVTRDGILLRTALDGVTQWEMNSVQRGPQPGELFAPPPGVQVMDMNSLPGMGEIMGRAQGTGN